jgi:hypothetical protein
MSAEYVLDLVVAIFKIATAISSGRSLKGNDPKRTKEFSHLRDIRDVRYERLEGIIGYAKDREICVSVT